MLIEEIRNSFVLKNNEKKLILSAINEALSINDDVLRITESVFKDFVEKSNKTPFIYDAWAPSDIKIKRVISKAEILGKEITFVFNCFNVLDSSKYETYMQKYRIGNAETSLKKYTVVVSAGFISGTLKTNVKSLLQHEIEHLYQHFKGKRLNSYDPTLSKNGPAAYKKAYSILSSNSGNVGKETFYVAYIIYSLSESEVDAFVNQLYRELEENHENNADEVLKDSNAYNYYTTSKRLLNIVKANRDDFEHVVEDFGFEYDKFIKVFSKLSKRYILKIGKVLTRYNEENQPDEVLLNDLNKTLKNL